MPKKIYVLVGLWLFVPLIMFGVEQHFSKLAVPDSQNYIVLTKPAFGTTLGIIELSTLAIPFFLFCWAAFKKQKPRWIILLAVLVLNVLSYPLIAYIEFFHTSWSGEWTVEDSTRGADGKTYYFLREGIYKGLVFGPNLAYVLARRESGNPFWFKAKILVRMFKLQRTTPILRPKPLKLITGDNPYRIYSSATGWVACFHGDKCAVAYNIKTKRSCTDWKLRKLSPYILVGDQARARKSAK
jgi:hypothetical protein